MASSPQGFEIHGQRWLRKRLEQSETRLRLLKSVSTRLNSGLAAVQIIERTMREAHKSFPHLGIAYFTSDDGHLLKVRHSVGPVNMPSWLETGGNPSATGALMQAMERGEGIVVKDVTHNDRLGALGNVCAASGTMSFVIVPIPQTEQPMGFLSFAAGQT